MNLAELVAPIPGAAPTGADVRYGDAHAAIRAEIKKEAALDGNTPAWDRVSRLSQALLKDASKDLSIAAYLAVAEMRLRGDAGLLSGLRLLRDLCERYWDALFPERRRLRGRVEALRWFFEQVERWSAAEGGLLGNAPDVEAVAACVEALDLLAVTLTAKLGEAAPSFGAVTTALAKRHKGAAQRPVTVSASGDSDERPAVEKEERPVPQPLDDSPSKPLRRGPAPPVGQPVDEAHLLRVTGKHLLDLARELRRELPESPAGYRLLRLALELPMGNGPQATDETQRTSLDPPREDLRQQIATLEHHQKWAALLEESESALVQNRYWLALHRSSCTALRALNRPAAAEEVMTVARLLLSRYPDLERLSFSDGSPFVDEATRDWLDIGTTRGATPEANTAIAIEAASVDTEPRQEASRAVRPAAAGELAQSGRGRFEARRALAATCVDRGDPQAARFIYAGLVADVHRHGLDEWDPPLAASAVAGLLRCLERGDADVAARREELAVLLWRIDPTAAAKVFTAAVAGVSAPGRKDRKNRRTA